MIFDMYRINLRNIPQVTILETDLSYHTPWFMDIFIEKRDELAAFLLAAGIKTRLMYSPVHNQKCYNIRGDFDVTSKMAPQGLWLPSSINIDDSQIDFVCGKIKEFYKNG